MKYLLSIKLFAFIVLSLIIAFFAYSNTLGQNSAQGNEILNNLEDGDTVELSIKDNEELLIEVEVAKSDSKKAYGLMNREEMSENTGMIFLYNEEEIRSFWMKDTLIPLDIIFLDSDLKIINIENAKANQTEERYRSEKESQYVIEMNAGWAKDNNINKGDSFVIK